MSELDFNFKIDRLGKPTIPSPVKDLQFASDAARLLYHTDLKSVQDIIKEGKEPPAFEVAGPREKIYFDPKKTKCGIVTCGGLCPGLNDVIRAVVMSLHYHYGIDEIYGFLYGYEGLNPKYGHEPIKLNLRTVDNIEEQGGTILGSSRGPQPVNVMLNTLKKMGINILFTVGGDGTQRGAKAIADEAKKQGMELSVIGIPKTIDNDISFIRLSFGFQTAAEEARKIINVAHTEAEAARNGVGLVRVMGRDSGFIAAFATMADSNVNFCLIPEVPFSLNGLLNALDARLKRRGHAVIVVAEGAGQDLLPKKGTKDASGNIKHEDIGIFLRDKIKDYFSKKGEEISMKYIDPSYAIRGIPANAFDSAFCLMLGQNAVHAGMSGRTNMVVGYWNHEVTHVPIALAASSRKKIDPDGWMWNRVLACTGQPKDLT
jgi:6-phosphofructokinase 1